MRTPLNTTGTSMRLDVRVMNEGLGSPSPPTPATGAAVAAAGNLLTPPGTVVQGPTGGTAQQGQGTSGVDASGEPGNGGDGCGSGRDGWSQPESPSDLSAPLLNAASSLPPLLQEGSTPTGAHGSTTIATWVGVNVPVDAGAARFVHVAESAADGVVESAGADEPDPAVLELDSSDEGEEEGEEDTGDDTITCSAVQPVVEPSAADGGCKSAIGVGFFRCHLSNSMKQGLARLFESPPSFCARAKAGSCGEYFAA